MGCHLCKPLTTPCAGPECFVAPDGTPEGTGSINDPLDIETALAIDTQINGERTVYLRGGDYNIAALSVRCQRNGTVDFPTTIQNYPGELVRLIDFGINASNNGEGNYIRLLSPDYNLVIQGTDTNREAETEAELDNTTGLDINGADFEVINIRIDNLCGTGITWFGPYSGLLYGCIVTNNGFMLADGGHGPGLYTAQDDETKTRRIENFISLNNFRYAIQIFKGGGNEDAHNFTVKNNTLRGGFIAGGEMRFFNLDVDGLWNTVHPIFGPAWHFVDPNGFAHFRNSVIGDPTSQFAMNFVTEATIEDNVFVVADNDLNELEGGTYTIQNNSVVSSGQYTQCLPNEYAPGFATLRAFDFDETGSVTMDVSALMDAGTIRVRNPMLWSEFQDFTVTGGTFTLPMTGWTTPAPNGFDEPLATVFSARFGVWIVEVV